MIICQQLHPLPDFICQRSSQKSSNSWSRRDRSYIVCCPIFIWWTKPSRRNSLCQGYRSSVWVIFFKFFLFFHKIKWKFGENCSKVDFPKILTEKLEKTCFLPFLTILVICLHMADFRQKNRYLWFLSEKLVAKYIWPISTLNFSFRSFED